MKKWIVLAGNYAQFRQWLAENKVSPQAAIYANSPEKIQGLEFSQHDIVKTGTWGESPITDEMLLLRIRKEADHD